MSNTLFENLISKKIFAFNDIFLPMWSIFVDVLDRPVGESLQIKIRLLTGAPVWAIF